jgi:hypothetical protein
MLPRRMQDPFRDGPFTFGERCITERYPHIACLVKALEAALSGRSHDNELRSSQPVDTCCPGAPIASLDKGDIIYRETMYSVVES